MRQTAGEYDFYRFMKQDIPSLQPQVKCCNGTRRVDFTALDGSGRRVPIELNNSSRGSHCRDAEVQDDFGTKIINIEQSDFERDRYEAKRKLKNRLR